MSDTGGTARRRSGARTAPIIVLPALLAWLAFRESGALDTGDVFWHLRTGDLILDQGLPRRDPFSWTAIGHPWQPNAWLGDVLWAGVRQLFGPAGVSALGGVAVVAIALLLYRACRRADAGPWAAVAVSSSVLVFMAPFIAPRPLLIGFVLMPIALELARRYHAGATWPLAALGVVFAAWSNLHGSFVTGVGVVAVTAAGWAIDERRLWKPLALALTCGVAGLVNPFGASAYLHTLDIRAESVNIDEWQPLSFTDARGILLVVFMAITAWAIRRTLAARREQTRRAATPSHLWERVLPVAALALGTLAIIRTGAFFLIVAAPLVAPAVSGIAAPRLRSWAAPRRGPITLGLVLAGVILAFQQVPTLARAGEPSPRFSESIVAAIPANCPLLNEYDVGGFVIDRRWPEVLVSQDGRNDLYGADELRRQESLLESTDVAALEQTGIRCVLANDDRPLTAALAASPEWEERFTSGELTLLVRR